MGNCQTTTTADAPDVEAHLDEDINAIALELEARKITLLVQDMIDTHEEVRTFTHVLSNIVMPWR